MTDSLTIMSLCLQGFKQKKGRGFSPLPFAGFRNFPAINRDRLIRTIIKFAELIEAHPDMIEMDINPLLWSFDTNEPIVVDSRCTIGYN